MPLSVDLHDLRRVLLQLITYIHHLLMTYFHYMASSQCHCVPLSIDWFVLRNKREIITVFPPSSFVT